MVELLNTIILLVFTAGLAATSFAIGRRLLDYRAAGLRPPLLAKRDMALLVSLLIPFFLIFLVRALGLGAVVQGQWWWTALTGIPPVIGVMQFSYIEFFVIERRDSRGYLAYLHQAEDEKEEREQSNPAQ